MSERKSTRDWIIPILIFNFFLFHLRTVSFMCIANADSDTHANWMIYTRHENRTLKNISSRF
jgi:hypothetical protein